MAAARVMGPAGPLKQAYYNLTSSSEGVFHAHLAGVPVSFHAEDASEWRRLEEIEGVGNECFLAVLAKAFKLGDVFYDVGSNIGQTEVRELSREEGRAMNEIQDATMGRARRFAAAGIHGTLFLLTGGLGRDITAALMYHSIEVDVPWAVPAAMFRKQMLRLKEDFRIVPFGRLPAECQRPPGSGNVIAITFDDGRLDNYVHALPILEDVGVKATFFIITSAIGGTFTFTGYQSPMMDESQLREVASLGHEIAAHGVSHARLDCIPLPDAFSELVNSKRHLEDLIGMPVPSMAYPFGEFNRAVRDCAAEAGYTCSGTAKHGLITPKSDWLQLPRVNINPNLGSGLYFRAQASHAMELYERLRGRSPRSIDY